MEEPAEDGGVVSGVGRNVALAGAGGRDPRLDGGRGNAAVGEGLR